MGKYLTEFSSNTEYNAALATLDYPNVSLVENQLKYAESLPTMYRWVDDGDNTRCGDDIEYDGCTLYQQTKKQMSINGGQTWTDVIPREYGYGDVIEEESSECGCGEGGEGEGCEWDWMDVDDYNYNSMVVMDIKFDNPYDGTWEAWYQNGTVYSFYINGNCDDDGCPVLKLEARMRYDEPYEDDDPRYYVEVKVYGNCDCMEGECSTLLDTQELDDGTSLNLYTYYDRAAIDDLHYDGSNSIPTLKLYVAEGNCIDQC